MSYSQHIALVCSIFLFIGCSQEENASQISYEIIQEAYFSYSVEEKIPSQFRVFRNEDEWDNFIQEIDRIDATQTENLKNLDFDFTNNNLIIVIGEFYNSCCSEITINAVFENNNTIRVDFSESGPGEATALSQAYLILKTKKNL